MFLQPGKPALLIVALCCAACGTVPARANPSATAAQSIEATGTAIKPSTTPSPSRVPPTPPPPRYFNEGFSAKPTYWSFLQVDNGQAYGGPSVQDGFLVFSLPSPNQWAYGFYNGPSYADVLIEAELQSRTSGDGAAGLVCRYDENRGWYEFNIFADHTFQLLFGQWLAPGLARYTPLYQGKSDAIRSDTNQIGLQCQGNNLTPYINGARMRIWPELKFGLQRGQVGLSVSSFTDAPFTITFDWLRVSEP